MADGEPSVIRGFLGWVCSQSIARCCCATTTTGSSLAELQEAASDDTQKPLNLVSVMPMSIPSNLGMVPQASLSTTASPPTPSSPSRTGLVRRPEVVLERPDGAYRYAGQWRDTHFEGRGVLVSADGSRYEGNFEQRDAWVWLLLREGRELLRGRVVSRSRAWTRDADDEGRQCVRGSVETRF